MVCSPTGPVVHARCSHDMSKTGLIRTHTVFDVVCITKDAKDFSHLNASNEHDLLYSSI